jgi:hypothetical protein
VDLSKHDDTEEAAPKGSNRAVNFFITILMLVRLGELIILIWDPLKNLFVVGSLGMNNDSKGGRWELKALVLLV